MSIKLLRNGYPTSSASPNVKVEVERILNERKQTKEELNKKDDKANKLSERW